MSQQSIKRYRKEVRRQVNHNMGEGLSALNELVRQRPTWVPRFLWVILYLPLFKTGYLRIIYRHF